METINTTFVKNAQASYNVNSLRNAYASFIKRLEFSHYGFMTMALLIGSCLGAITAMRLFEVGAATWIFAVGLFATMANLVACIAQVPTRWVLYMFSISVLVNVSLVVISLL